MGEANGDRERPWRRNGADRQTVWQILTLALAALLAVGSAAYWVIGSVTQQSAAQHETNNRMTDVYTQLQANIADARATCQAGIADLNTRTAPLPDQKAHLDALERWQVSIDNRLQQQDARLLEIERDVIGMRSRLDGIDQASHQPLGGRR
jgi:cell division protein FtsB